MKLPDETLIPAEPVAAGGARRNDDAATLFLFAGFSLDVGMNTLTRAGEPVSLRPKSLEMLKYLVQRHGETVSRHALARVIWMTPPADVDASIAQCVKDIRATLGPGARGMLQTVPGVGYVFRGQVNREPVSPPIARIPARDRAPTLGRFRWWIAGTSLGLAAVLGAAGAFYLLAPAAEPANDPLAVRESYNYRPNRTIMNNETVTITTSEGKTIICRGGNDGTKVPRRCWWGKP